MFSQKERTLKSFTILFFFHHRECVVTFFQVIAEIIIQRAQAPDCHDDIILALRCDYFEYL